MNYRMLLASMALVAGVAQAEPTTLVYKIESGANAVNTLFTILGVPAAASHSTEHLPVTCLFKTSLGESTLTMIDNESTSIQVLADAITPVGAKTMFVFSTITSGQQGSVRLDSGDCSVPTGSVESTTLRSVDLLRWGQPHSYTLSNGAVVKVTATKLD